MNTSYLNSLNEKQREAVMATEGPVIVLAGAGSGKTKTLITRIAHLMNLGVDPGSILAVTFTNKAAAEMKHRVEKLLRESQSNRSVHSWAQPWMGFSPHLPEVSTFHSFCVKLLRNEYLELGFTRPFVIYDDQDQSSLLKKILESMDFDPKQYKRFKGNIDQLKCQGMGPQEMDPQDFFPVNFGEQLQKVYARYQEGLRANNAFDFGDLIVEAYKLLKNRADLLEKYQNKFKYLMVDEYQDTNRAQYLLVNLLAKKTRNICVVGDEDQSIYKWRGADIKNIMEFKRDYPEATMVKLEQNYRSTKNIIDAASAVIRNNKERYDKTLWTDQEPGDKLRWAQLPDERAEAEFVAKEIQKWLAKNPDSSHLDAAIFYRSHAQSRAYEEAFRKSRIPYKIVGGVGFYERKEIKDVLAYLRSLVNPDDSVSLLRIINVPARGLGKTTLDKVEEYAYHHRISFYAALKKQLEEGILPPSAKKKIADFVKLMDGMRDLASRSTVTEIYHKILDATGYVLELKAENTDEAKARIQNLEEFDTVVQFFEEDAARRGLKPEDGMLQGFLNQITLEASLLEKADESPTGAVSMMTLHSSKGLEYPLVFLVGAEEGIFPSRQAMDEDQFGSEAIEEERRLCYVGITRARRNLIITSAAVRRIYGQVQVSGPSRFLGEIPKDLINVEVQRAEASSSSGWNTRTSWESSSRSSSSSYSSRSSSSDSGRRYDYSESDHTPSYEVKAVSDSSGQQIKVGQKVRHSAYGMGTVKTLEGAESDRKITIEFPGKVVKKFALKHVELEIV